ncbi:MAG: type I-E CRISPR-associated protein Cas7/Cse4/CasC [Burkholderiaceae bacterium]|nr:type I-E CRISPR-associated protein Cas7/Cse4/CasC [Burkholderiaceae bacterium]
MRRFLQLHLLTNYPPANLNRDDTGRPKTALMGDAQRLRVSSQSLKRAWRTSEVFKSALTQGAAEPTLPVVVLWEDVPHANLGTRTKEVGVQVYKAFAARGIADKDAKAWASSIAQQFGKLQKEKKDAPLNELRIEQLCHLGPEERAAVDALVDACASRKSGPSEGELALLRAPHRAVDIAMFGRMLADSPSHNVEAAVQVAHAVTVHKAAVEDDYFSAVDDLNRDDKGAGHIGERGFGAGLFYQYVCVNRELLAKNLGDANATLVGQALEALVHSITMVSPTGMQNSHGSRAFASYVLAEKGDEQPRSLVQSFLEPVKPREGEGGMLALAVAALERRCINFDKVYGACAGQRQRMNAEDPERSVQGDDPLGPVGSLADMVAFAQAD